tara:strand:+ start:727 stop:1395 length:669 start_codon:yes stop_codon:yes gene_type:complete
MQKPKILAVIPARKNSKGIKNKNILKINKKTTLIEYTFKFVKSLNFITKIVFTSDSKLMIKLAEKMNIYSIKRKKNLSTSKVSAHSVWRDALILAEKRYKKKFDFTIYFEPTSPIRRKKNIIKGIRLITKKKLDMVLSLSKTSINNKDYFQNGKKIKISKYQEKQTYVRNGIFYICKRDHLLKNNNIFSKSSRAVIIDHEYSNIDNYLDFLKFKYLIEKNYA